MILHLFPDAKGHLPEPSAMLFVFALPEKGKQCGKCLERFSHIEGQGR